MPENSSSMPSSQLSNMRHPSREHVWLQAWETFVDRYSGMMYGLCRRMRIPDSSCHDVCQEAMVKLFRNLHQYQKLEGRSFRGWLRTIVRNECVNWIRKHAKHQSEPLTDVEQKETSLVDKICEQEFFAQAIDLTRNHFEFNTWKCFELYKDESKSIPEIATLLGLSTDAVKQNVFRVKSRLKNVAKELDQKDRSELS